MSDDRFMQFIGLTIFALLMAVFVIAFYDALLSSPAAAEPGDLFYPQQQTLVRTLNTVLPWMVPGVFAAAILVLGYLRDEF